MATDRSFVDHVVGQSGLGDALTCKRMFGEYALYLYGRVVAFACDNQLYMKPTDAGRRLLVTPRERPPYPGGKPHFLLDEETENRELLRRLFEATADALPLPKPKPTAKATPKPAARPKAARRPAPGKPEAG